jgi:hypothetical protein
MQLFDGSTLNNWAPTGNAESWTIDEGCIHCKALKGKNLYYTQEQFQNFELSLECKQASKFKFSTPTDGNLPPHIAVVPSTIYKRPLETHANLRENGTP